jgi:DNA-binding response OmpR family regulator
MPRGSLRVVVVDHDVRTKGLFEAVVAPPEFELRQFDDPVAALVELQAIDPDVVVCADRMPGMRAADFIRGVRGCARFPDLACLVLVNDALSRREMELVLGAGDACLIKPVSVPLLLQRLRGARRERGEVPPPHALSGQTDRTGLLGLLKLCEDARLTGRFRVESRGEQVFIDYLAGAPVFSGATPDDPARDALERLLAMDGGRYVFEPQRVRGGASGSLAQGAFATAGGGAAGRFSMIEKDARRYQVYTEAFHSPNLAVISVVAVSGQGLRKIETLWPHPMKRDADAESVRAQVERQHQSVLQMVEDGAFVPPSRRKVWDVAGGGVEGSVLVWVLSLLRDIVAARLGLAPTIGLLRQSLRELVPSQPALAAFRVGPSGGIEVSLPKESTRATLSGIRLPRGVVEGVAAWATIFRAEAGLLVSSPRLPTIRRATRMMADELDRVGFYAALEDERARA